MIRRKEMDKLRISAIRYANTYPLNYGLRESGIEEFATIDIDHPAECARKLINNEVDIGLVPVAAISDINNARIISNYCIGTNSPVRTVLLVSNEPLGSINTVYLDYRSRSSVALARILAREYWNKSYKWINTSDLFDFKDIPDGSGLVIIGDQCFELEDKYTYRTDLASEWKKMTGLPFVFACWVANKELDIAFINKFNDALKYGINNIGKAIQKYKSYSSMSPEILTDYLTNNIDFDLDEEKKKAMKLFIDYIKRQKVND